MESDSPKSDRQVLNHALSDLYDESLSPISLLPDERYTDQTLIAKGGLKEISKVYDNHCNRYIALARLKSNNRSMGETLDFIREIQLTSLLEHPSIIRIYDLGIDDRGPWFSMELLSGTTVTEYLEKKPELSISERVQIFSQICDAISSAHEQDTLHLDIKPDNIIIGEHGKITIYDWGMGYSSLNHDDLQIKKTHYKGTLGFMAPEQLIPDVKETKASDVYGLGSLLYYLLTNQAPIRGKTNDDLKKNTLLNRPGPLDLKSIPPRLTPLLEKTLAGKPEDRYQDAISLNSEIKSYIRGHATRVENPSSLTLAKLFIQRNKAACALSAIFTTLFLSGAGAYFFTLKQSNTKIANALTTSELAETDAKKARSKAEAARQTAEDTLKSLREEQDLRMSINNKLVRTLISNNKTNLNQSNFSVALQSAKAAVRNDPDNNEVRMQLGFTHFIMQDFSEAARAFELADLKKDDDIQTIANAHKNIKGKASVEQITKIIETIDPVRKVLLVYILQYDAQVRSPQDHSTVVRSVLKLINKNKLKTFKYNAQTQSLILKGNNLRLLIRLQKPKMSLDLLDSLPIKTLQVNKTLHIQPKTTVKPQPKKTPEKNKPTEDDQDTSTDRKKGKQQENNPIQ